jgi:prevent-host-death family protein
MKRATRKVIEEVAVSEFKAKCLSLLDRVNKTKTPLRVTRRGVPIAEVVPISPEDDRKSWFGSMTGILKVTGDIVSPVIDPDDFEALRD